MDTGARLRQSVRDWTPPVELGLYIPRQVKLTGVGKVLVLLATTFCIGSLIGGVLLYTKASRDRAERLRIETRGIDSQARVTRRWSTKGEEPGYGVDYAFEAEGQTYSGRIQVGRRSWDRLEAGSSLQIRYLPADPRQNLVKGHEPDLTPLWLPFLIGGALNVAGLLIVRVVVTQHSLLANGRAAPGLITGHKRDHNGKSATYTFTLLSGAPAEGKTRPTKKSPPPVNSAVCVIYEPDNPRHNAVYPFALVKPARVEAGTTGRHRPVRARASG